MRFAILGAGVSGLTAARLLKDKGHMPVVYEKCHTIGGLARTRFTEGYLYDPHGGHIFNSKHHEVMDWVFSILPKDNWQFIERNAKIYFDGRYIPYPFELSLCELEPDIAADCIYDYITARQGGKPDNFKDWLIWGFGKSIAEYYMIPYNQKIWSYPLEDMEVKFMEGKMPFPSKKEMIKSVLLKDPTERKMPHSTFYYPLKGGIQTMVDAIAEDLNIKTDYTIETISKHCDGWYINNIGPYDTVISTIPLTELRKIMPLPNKIQDHIAELKYNSLTTVLFTCPKTDTTWLYIPSHDYKSHRIGYQSALTPYACPDPSMGCGALEIIGAQFKITEDWGSGDKILPEDLGFRKVIDSEFTEYAYVVHDKKYRSNIGPILEYFSKEDGFELLGRWGTWNYKNMDLCMYDAMNLVKKY